MTNVIRTDEGQVYYVVEFDAKAQQKKSGKHTPVLDLLRKELEPKNGYTDVIIVSHGWREFRDPGIEDPKKKGSIGLPNKLVPALDRTKPSGTKPLYVAISWPSVPSLSSLPSDDLEKLPKLLQLLIEQLAVENGSQATKQAADEANREATLLKESKGKDRSQSKKVLEKAVVLANEIAADVDSAGGDTLIDSKKISDVTSAETIGTQSRPSALHADITPLKTDEDDDSNSVYQKVYTLLFGEFERLASKIGSDGVHGIIAELMRVADEKVRFSAFGHSLGAHVVQAAAIGNGKNQFGRKMHTILMAQGACGFSGLEPGRPYHPLVSGLKPVAGPLLATRSWVDTALQGYRVAGWFGFGSDEPLGLKGFSKHESYQVVEKKIGVSGFFDREKLKKDVCYTIDGDGLVPIISDHGDIADDEVTELFWEAATLELSRKELVPSVLPPNYWIDYKLSTSST